MEEIPAALRDKVQRAFEEREWFFQRQQQAFELTQERLRQEILRLRHLVRLYQIDRFGASSEKLTDVQMALLNLEPSVSRGEVEVEAQLSEAEKTVAGAPALEDLAQEIRKAHAPLKAKSKSSPFDRTFRRSFRAANAGLKRLPRRVVARSAAAPRG